MAYSNSTPIIIACELCSEDMERTSPRQKYHAECREIVRAEQNRNNQRKIYNRKRKTPGTPVTYDQAWANLAIAVVKFQCDEEGVDYEKFKEWLLDEQD